MGFGLRLRDRPRTRSVMAPKKARVADEPAACDVCVFCMFVWLVEDQLISFGTFGCRTPIGSVGLSVPRFELVLTADILLETCVKVDS